MDENRSNIESNAIDQDICNRSIAPAKNILKSTALEPTGNDDSATVSSGDAHISNNIVKNNINANPNDVVSAFDVARYILEKLHQCTAMKLQKLLYYCQSWYLVWNDKPLFSEPIEAWANGPVVRSVFQCHRGLYTLTPMNFAFGNMSKLTDQQKSDIDSVLDAYGDKSSQWLVNKTHLELPWQKARKGLGMTERGNVIIPLDSMAEYYSALDGQK